MTRLRSIVSVLSGACVLACLTPGALGSASVLHSMGPKAQLGGQAKRCKYVIKRVRGKRIRVRVCKRKRKPTLPLAGKVIASIHVPSSPLGLAVTPDAVWVAQHEGTTIARIDPATNRIVAHVSVATDGSQPARLVFAGGFLWSANYSGNSVVKVDPQQNRAVATVTLPTQNCCLPAVGAGSLWVLGSDDNGSQLTRIDPTTGAISGAIHMGDTDGIAFAAGSVWGVSQGTLWRVDPAANAIVATYDIHAGSAGDYFVTAGAGSVWISSGDKVIRFDPTTGAVAATIRVPGVSPVAATDNAVWVASSTKHSLERIDPATNKIIGRVPLPFGGDPDVQIGPDSVWVSVFESNRVVRIRPKP